MPKNKLTNIPARTDLTDRECAKIIGGVIGGLCQLTCPMTVRAAVEWWAAEEHAWEVMQKAVSHAAK